MALEGTQEAALVLGFPGRFAVALALQLLSFRPRAIVYVLVPPGAGGAGALSRSEFSRHWQRVRCLEGDVQALDFGLSATEYRELTDGVRAVHHCEGISEVGQGRASARDGKAGTRLVASMQEVLAFCQAAQCLESLIVYSSLAVSGTYSGVFAEPDLNVGQRFDSAHDEGLAISEQMVRAQGSAVPATILRVGELVLDTELSVESHESALFMLLTETVRSASAFHVPMNVRGDELFHLTPMSYVIRAGLFLAGNTSAHGNTLHLVEPRALSVREVLTRAAEVAGRPAPIFGSTSGNWLSSLRFGSEARAERAALKKLKPGLRYGTEVAERLLASAGLACPAFESYLDILVQGLSTETVAGQPNAS